ncbi:MAG: RNA ligase (ATP) [bacterium]|nr:RNA ligase (ATP) [bacterium]
MRTLASVQKILKIEEIPGAESIVKATVLGWSVVVKKDEFKEGDLCVYIEIDSILPAREEFAFLEKVKYRIKTIRLRGQVSQGICFPLSILPAGDCQEGQDVTELLGIIKYEPPVPAQLAGQVKGVFPEFIPKTDEPRIQTCPQVLERYKDTEFYATEKIDGTSATIYVKDGVLEICSRRLLLREDTNNSYWKVARELNLEEKLKAAGEKYALQGELSGEGIQKNILKFHGQKLFIFNIYDFLAGKYLPFSDIIKLCGDWGVDVVPIVIESFKLPQTVEEIVKLATRKSIINPEAWAEGLVFRPKTEQFDPDLGRLSFKAVNPEFLLQYGED